MNNFIVGVIGELILVEAFVFWIWIKVFIDAVKSRDGSISQKKLLLTSLGLVLNAVAIFGIMSFRLSALLTNQWPFLWGITAFYVMLSLGNFMFIVSASLGESTKMLKLFLFTTLAWLLFIKFTYFV